VPAPGVPAAALMARPEKMMVSVHIESLLLYEAISIYLNRI